MVPSHPFRDRLYATPDTSGAGPSTSPPPIDDRRQRPAGVIPRRLQTWAVITVALLMLFIMFTTRPAPPGSATDINTAGDPTLDTQDQQRAAQTAIEQYRRQVDEHQRLLDQRQRTSSEAAKESVDDAYSASPAPPRDPMADERKRREYESLFASSVAHSVRGTAGSTPGRSQTSTGTNVDDTDPTAPSRFDPNIAAAVALALQQQQINDGTGASEPSTLPEPVATTPSAAA
ncbi:MAG: hypothetical protein ACRD2X_05765, partial [Vicinamibacteraceae bacterium]